MRQWIKKGLYGGAACVTAALMLNPAQAGMDDVLDQASDGADLVLAVPSMSKLSEAVADLNAKLGLQQAEMDDALSSFKREMGLGEGVDDNGPMLMVITDLVAALENDTEPDALVLVPVSDYNAFVTSLGGTADGVSEVQLQSDKGFAKKLGDFAVLGENKEAVEAYTAGGKGDALLEKVGSYGNDYSDDSLMAVFLDMADLAPALTKQIDAGLEQMKQDLAAQAAEGQPLPMDPEKMADAYGKLGKTFVNGLEGVVFTLDYGDAGAGVGMGSALKEGSELAGYFKGEASDGSILTRLPDQTYLYAGSVDLTGMELTPLIEMAEEIMAAMDQGPMAGMMAQAKQSLAMMKQVKRLGQVWYAPNANDPMAMMTGGFMSFLNVYEVEDGEALRDQWQKSMEAMGQIAVPVDQGQEAAQMTLDVTYQPSAMQVEGVRVDQYQINMQLPPEMMQGNPMAMMMMNGYGGYVAATDDAVLMTTGGTDPKLITDGLAAIGKTEGLGAGAKLNTLRSEQLPEALFAEGYLSLGGVAEMANPMLQMFGGMPPIQVPADLSPIAAGLGQQDGSLGGRWFVPMDVMLFIKDTVNQFAPAMAPGMGGQGGNDGAPPAPF